MNNNKVVNKIVWQQLRRLGWIAVAAGTAVTVDAQTASEVRLLEELVVTGQRRTTDLQDAAVSASVLTGDTLTEKGIDQLYGIQFAAPSVKIANYGSANVFNIRGIGRTQVDIDVPSGVVIYRDGAPTIAGYFQGEPYYDMESIEVFRGPQGTFAGKSASGGAVFINTNDPSLDGNTGSVKVGAGNFSAKEVVGVANLALSDSVATRFSYRHFDSDSFYDSITGNFTGHPGERDMNSYRAAVLFDAGGSFKGLFKADYHDLDFGGNVVSSPNTPLYEVEQNGDIRYEDESLRVVADLEFAFANDLTLTSLTAYQDLDTVNNLDVNASDPVFYQFKSTVDVSIVSQEFNLVSSEAEPVRWIVGTMYYKQEVDIPYWQEDGFTFTGNGNGTDFPWLTSPWQKQEDEWSVFGHLAMDMSDDVEMEIGVRYSDYFTDQFTEWVLGDGDTPPTDEFAPAGTQELSERATDWHIGLNKTLNDEHFIYGLISRGHTTGGINIFPPFRIYEAMDVVNYEAGWKAEWAEGQVKTQTTLFYQDFDKYQVNFEQNAAFGVPGQDNRNAPGNSVIWGLEFSTQAHINNLHMDYNLAYLQSDIGDFEGAVDPFRTAPDNIVDLSGIDIPFVSEISTNLGIGYDFYLGQGEGLLLTPRFDLAYTSDTQTKLWDTDLVRLEDRTLLNLNMTLRSTDDAWSASLWVTNATDEEYVAAIQNLASLYYAGRPREYGINVQFNFN